MIQTRVKKVQKSLTKWGVDAIIVQSPVDLFYLTGIELSAGSMVIGKQHETLIVDGRYFEKCQKETPFKVVKMAPDALGKSKALAGAKRVGFGQESTSFANYLKLKKELSQELINLSRPIEQIRAIKDPSEIVLIEKAVHMMSRGFDFLCTRLRRGVFEKTLAKELEMFWLTSGADKLAFEPIIAFGKNSSMPHYRAGGSPLKPNDAILVDIGCVVDGYAADMTRMLFYGKADPRLEKIYEVVRQAQMKAIKAIKPGVKAAKLYDIAKKVIDQAGFGDSFLHGLGHGIGLEVHEYPKINAEAKDYILEAGMCVTIEPGIYLPNIGGVRIEDMLLVTADGYRELTGCPKAEVILPVV